MPPQGPGMLGALPRPAWGTVLGLLSTPEDDPDRAKARQATVLSLRRTCKALAELVGAGCAGGAGRLDVRTVDAAAQLEAAATAGLGRALLVICMLRSGPSEVALLEAQVRAVAVAVERGHMIRFVGSSGECPPTAARTIEAALIEASREGQLLNAFLLKGEASGWSVDVMAQLSVVELAVQERETIAALVGVGTLWRLKLWFGQWTDMSILSSLREVELHYCAVDDVSALADVPLLVVSRGRIKALPAMRNDVLKVADCNSLTDVSGLAGGHVGHLELNHMDSVEDVSAIGAMRPPPRTVVLEGIDEVQDVSMLAGIRRLEVIECRKLDKAATLAALEGKVGTILWRA